MTIESRNMSHELGPGERVGSSDLDSDDFKR